MLGMSAAALTQQAAGHTPTTIPPTGTKNTSYTNGRTYRWRTQQQHSAALLKGELRHCVHPVGYDELGKPVPCHEPSEWFAPGVDGQGPVRVCDAHRSGVAMPPQPRLATPSIQAYWESS